jgi:hypothetical protein
MEVTAQNYEAIMVFLSAAKISTAMQRLLASAPLYKLFSRF